VKPDDIAKCIPDEVAKAGGQLLHATDDVFNLVTWDELDDHDRNSYCNHARDVIALGLAAWPGAVDHPKTVISPRCIWLPLKETQNDQG
jgi:hypothetical protein